jgi:hypothetical protein
MKIISYFFSVAVLVSAFDFLTCALLAFWLWVVLLAVADVCEPEIGAAVEVVVSGFAEVEVEGTAANVRAVKLTKAITSINFFIILLI